MKSIIIYDRNGWTVKSYGNGTSYALEYNGASCLFQGDDASIFESEMFAADGFFIDDVEKRFMDYVDIMESVR